MRHMNDAPGLVPRSKSDPVLTCSTLDAGSRLRGKLAGFMHMPIEMLAEISLHLHPLDLLQMARASKTFRDILMSKRSKVIWQTARRNQVPGMPECPDALAEPQYAALVFTTTCQACGNTGALFIYHGLCTRHCAQCVNSQVIRVHPNGRNILLLRLVKWKCFSSIVPIIQTSSDGSRWVSKETCDALAKEWLTLKSEEAQLSFISSRRVVMKAIQKLGLALQEWETEDNFSNTQELLDIAQRRSIFKLLDMGWDAEDIPTADRRGVNPEYREWCELMAPVSNQIMTKRVWNDLLPRLQPLLAASRVKRLQSELYMEKYNYRLWSAFRLYST